MKISIKKWYTESYCDICLPRTTATVIAPTVTLSVTINGHFTRKQVIERVYLHLLDESRWSPSFLRELVNTK